MARRRWSSAPARRGLTDFSSYLSYAARDPIYLLADFVEEEFQEHQVPHVVGPDRRALIRSKRRRLFGDAPYAGVVFQGREREGRRDDRFLFSALRRPDLIEPWVERIAKRKAPLAGVYSPPFLTGGAAPGDPGGFLASPGGHVAECGRVAPDLLRRGPAQALAAGDAAPRGIRTRRRLPDRGDREVSPLPRQPAATGAGIRARRLRHRGRRLARSPPPPPSVPLRRPDAPHGGGGAGLASRIGRTRRSGLRSSLCLPVGPEAAFLPVRPRVPHPVLRDAPRPRGAERGEPALRRRRGTREWSPRARRGGRRKRSGIAGRPRAPLRAALRSGAGASAAHSRRSAVDEMGDRGRRRAVRAPELAHAGPAHSERRPGSASGAADRPRRLERSPPSSETPGARGSGDEPPDFRLGAPAPPGDVYQSADVEGRIEPFHGDYREALAQIGAFVASLRHAPRVVEVQVLSLPLDVGSETTTSGDAGVGASGAEAPFALRMLLRPGSS